MLMMLMMLLMLMLMLMMMIDRSNEIGRGSVSGTCNDDSDGGGEQPAKTPIATSSVAREKQCMLKQGVTVETMEPSAVQ